MVRRIRSKAREVSSGVTIHIDSDTKSPWYYTPYMQSMTDYTGKKKRKDVNLLPDSDWDYDQSWSHPVRVNHLSGSPWKHIQVPCDYRPSLINYPERGYTQRHNENSFFAAQLVAMTHPFRSEFSIPTAIAELLDIGSLFRLTAKSFAEFAGNTYLNYKFGWVQFVQDIRTLHSITKALESRIKEFDSLSKHGGLRRSKIGLYTTEFPRSGTGYTFFTSYGLYLQCNWTVNATYSLRGSLRWRWKNGVKVDLTKLEAFNLAVSKIFDLGQLDASTIWNTIPWTWLADYFIAIGPWLSATEDSDFVEPYDISITRKFHTVETWYPTSNSSHTWCSNGVYTRTILSRDTDLRLPTLPPARFSLISMSQYLVLASLYSRIRGSRY